jgi:hypothetical protein
LPVWRCLAARCCEERPWPLLAASVPAWQPPAFAQSTPIAGATPAADLGKHTINGWGVTDADYDVFNVSKTIEPPADGWQTKAITDDPNTYEWWYFDIQFADGRTITLTLSPQSTFGFVPRFGAPQGIAVISYNAAGKQRNERAFFSLDKFSAATDRLDVQAGPFSVQGDFDRLHIAGEVNGLALDASFEQRATPVRFGNGYIFVGSTDRWEGWFNAFPVAHATGTPSGCLGRCKPGSTSPGFRATSNRSHPARSARRSRLQVSGSQKGRVLCPTNRLPRPAGLI